MDDDDYLEDGEALGNFDDDEAYLVPSSSSRGPSPLSSLYGGEDAHHLGGQGSSSQPSERDGHAAMDNFESLSLYFDRNMLETDFGLGIMPSDACASAGAPPSRLARNRRYQGLLRSQLVALDGHVRTVNGLLRWLKRIASQNRRATKAPLANGQQAEAGNGGRAAMHLACDAECREDGMAAPSFDARAIPPLRVLLAAPQVRGLFAEGPAGAPQAFSIDEYHGVLRQTAKWLPRERTALATAVRKANQEMALQKLLAGNEEEEEEAPPAARAGKLTPTYHASLSSVARISHRQLEMNIEGLDWGRISKHYVPSRSPVDCCIQWTCNQHPLISHAAFDEGETARLLAAVKEKGPHGRWVEIASAVGSNRTAWQALAHYCRHGGGEGGATAGKWSPEEDAALVAAIAALGSDRWTEISDRVEGRTAAQCVHRWNKALDPHKRMGRWLPHEDAWLSVAVQRYPQGNWALIQNFVPHRTDVQCRERYHNNLDPAMKRSPFTEEEDARLVSLVAIIGDKSWSHIAAELGGARTDNQCRRRFVSLENARKAAARPQTAAARRVGARRQRAAAELPPKRPRTRQLRIKEAKP